MVTTSERRTRVAPRHSAGPRLSSRLLVALLVGVVAVVAIGVTTLLLPGDDSSGSGTGSAPSTTSPRPRTDAPAIALDAPPDVVDPMAPVPLTGSVQGVPERRRLVVQAATSAEDWTSFPLQPVVDGGGRFRTFVELGASGEHRLRVVDPTSGATSAIVVVRVR